MSDHCSCHHWVGLAGLICPSSKVGFSHVTRGIQHMKTNPCLTAGTNHGNLVPLPMNRLLDKFPKKAILSLILESVNYAV